MAAEVALRCMFLREGVLYKKSDSEKGSEDHSLVQEKEVKSDPQPVFVHIHTNSSAPPSALFITFILFPHSHLFFLPHSVFQLFHVFYILASLFFPLCTRSRDIPHTHAQLLNVTLMSAEATLNHKQNKRLLFVDYNDSLTFFDTFFCTRLYVKPDGLPRSEINTYCTVATRGLPLHHSYPPTQSPRRSGWAQKALPVVRLACEFVYFRRTWGTTSPQLLWPRSQLASASE